MSIHTFTKATLACMVLSTALYAQDVKTSYKFDFRSGKPKAGSLQVLPATIYSKETGYGFDFGTLPAGVTAAASGQGIAIDKPVYFSAKVPEGNYRVTVTLGDKKRSTNTTIKSESRRLMMENIQTKAGQMAVKTFIVNIKDRNIDANTQMKLKPRELTKLDWDEKLTLEFDLNTVINSIEIDKVDDQITVFLAGNSTVVNQDAEPWGSWGQMIPAFFKPGVAICNQAESGYALNSFIGDRRFAKILSIMKPGDYVFVEFGHNDEKETGPNAGAYKGYTERLHTFATEVKKKQGNLVIVTPTARRSFGPDGKMRNTHGDYPDAARKVAQEENVPLIDLTALSTQLFETMGEQGSIRAFEVNPTTGAIDNTHFQPYGAYELAKVIAQAIKDKKLGISKFLVDMPAFDPAHPDPVDKFVWPPSPRVDMVKPEGN